MVKQGDAWPIAMKVVQDWGFSVAINGSKRLLVGLVGLIGDVKRLEPMPKLDFVTSTITHKGAPGVGALIEGRTTNPYP
jgi:hypothetical protein